MGKRKHEPEGAMAHCTPPGKVLGVRVESAWTIAGALQMDQGRTLFLYAQKIVPTLRGITVNRPKTQRSHPHCLH
jgi:hypothetical protein